ncbi:MAG: hypothetical protein IPQ03_01630 [Bacteroidetes bacterium]|nr:hypothetical protein [Bacteroidota bacterium]
MIDFISPKTGEDLILSGNSLISTKGESFPVIGGIPRFVPADNYASAFGLQWKTFAKTQLDSFSGLDITKERLERCLGFPLSGTQIKISFGSWMRSRTVSLNFLSNQEPMFIL